MPSQEMHCVWLNLLEVCDNEVLTWALADVMMVSHSRSVSRQNLTQCLPHFNGNLIMFDPLELLVYVTVLMTVVGDERG